MQVYISARHVFLAAWPLFKYPVAAWHPRHGTYFVSFVLVLKRPGRTSTKGDDAGENKRKKEAISSHPAIISGGLYHCDGAIQQLQIGGPGPRRFLSVCAPGTNRLT